MKVNRHTYKKNPYIPPIIEIEMIEEAGVLNGPVSGNATGGGINNGDTPPEGGGGGNIRAKESWGEYFEDYFEDEEEYDDF